MNRDSIPAFVLLVFFVGVFGFALRFGPSSAKPQVGAERAKARYEVEDEITLNGVVTGRLRTHPTLPVVVTLKTDRQSFDLALAPESYMSDVVLRLNKGDQVRMTGTKGLLNDEDVVLVREVTTGNRTVALRDSCGVPAWKSSR